jgi:hypothetical protein
MQQTNSSSLPATINKQNGKTMIKASSGKSSQKDNKLGVEDFQ